ncbi:MAG TPA: hypothetical protein VKD43_09500 [Xanthobacteraceae bacterium]|nr:hypothetical protein [Xanthobacteraceae bacterium]
MKPYLQPPPQPLLKARHVIKGEKPMSVAQALNRQATARAFWLGFAAYVVPTFPIGYVWHLVAFAPTYHGLAMYRDDIIIPFGFLSMLIQGAAFSWVYPRVFSDRSAWLSNGVRYGLALAALSWSFTTLAVAAKNVMTSVPTYMLLETGFTLVQFAVVGPLIALAYRN